jgi:uracil-DNA glycosylase family 4
MKTNLQKQWEQLGEEIVNCTLCPRLVEWRERVARKKKAAYRDDDYWGKPVLGFGAPDPHLFIIGLAPGAHGANRTGRMFTGDGAGDTLTAALYRAGLANRDTSTDRQDGLELRSTFISAVARCVPPDNKLTTQELVNCRPFLERELSLCHSVKVVLALGHTAFNGYLRLLREKGITVPRLKPQHGDCYSLDSGLPVLAFSYHPSRQNTQTGRLTNDMLDDLFDRVKKFM